MVSDWFSLLLTCTSIETCTDSADNIWWLTEAQDEIWKSIIGYRYQQELACGRIPQLQHPKVSWSAWNGTFKEMPRLKERECNTILKSNYSDVMNDNFSYTDYRMAVRKLHNIYIVCKREFPECVGLFIQLVKCTLIPFYLYSRLSWWTNYFCAVHLVNWNHVT